MLCIINCLRTCLLCTCVYRFYVQILYVDVCMLAGQCKRALTQKTVQTPVTLLHRNTVYSTAATSEGVPGRKAGGGVSIVSATLANCSLDVGLRVEEKLNDRAKLSNNFLILQIYHKRFLSCHLYNLLNYVNRARITTLYLCSKGRLFSDYQPKEKIIVGTLLL